MSNVNLEIVDDFVWSNLANKNTHNNFFLTPSFSKFFDNVFKFELKSGNELLGLAMLPAPDEKGFGIQNDLIIHSGINLFKDLNNKLPIVKFNEINFKSSNQLASFISKNYKKIRFTTTYQNIDLRPFLWKCHANKNTINIKPKYTTVKDISMPVDGNFFESNLFKTIIYEKRRKIRKSKENSINFLPNNNVSEFIDNYQEMMSDYGQDLDYKQIQKMNNVIQECCAEDVGKIFDIYSDEKCLYKCFVAWHNEYAYNLYSTKTKYSLINNWYGAYLFWEIFCFLSAKGIKFFDFEGVNSPNRGWYKESFGGDLKLYFEIDMEINE